ncbi:hypothetical protein ACIBG0_38385 [Nocardia sp. NPDC050630]|uniref:hypothetical protein n=1 Tax=Nocardia sp. NPDC050630 TaxID=3364321 RepID=UPI0037970DD3
MRGALAGAGFEDERVIGNTHKSLGITLGNAANYSLSNDRVTQMVAATQRLQSSARRVVHNDPNQSFEEVAADIATLRSSAFRYRRDKSQDGDIHLSAAQRDWADAYMNNDTAFLGSGQRDAMKDLMERAGGDSGAYAIAHLTPDDAKSIRAWIGAQQANNTYKSVEKLIADPTN